MFQYFSTPMVRSASQRANAEGSQEPSGTSTPTEIMGAMWTDDDLGDEPSTQSMGSSHLDSPMERQAARERAEQGKKNATGEIFKGGMGRVDSRANEVTQFKDTDGDGQISLLEMYDKDGDGKLEMEEYAAITNQLSGTAGGVRESYAAASAGVGRRPEAKKAWSALRDAQRHGQYIPTQADRVRTDTTHFMPSAGGWVNVSPPGQRWSVPGGHQSNLNVRSPEAAADGNPFSSRLFSGSPTGSHYAVADRSNETYAYSGARGIFKNVDADSHFPPHYIHERERLKQREVLKKFNTGPKLPGTDVTSRGGWPVSPTYGELPKGDRPGPAGARSYGWSIERGVQPTNATHTAFGTARITPSA